MIKDTEKVARTHINALASPNGTIELSAIHEHTNATLSEAEDILSPLEWERSQQPNI